MERLILFCPRKVNKKQKIFEYIMWGEAQKFNKRPSVKGQKYWYIIPFQSIGVAYIWP